MILDDCLQSVFLPQGYPESVSDDYFIYQIWDTVQVSNLINCIKYMWFNAHFTPGT